MISEKTEVTNLVTVPLTLDTGSSLNLYEYHSFQRNIYNNMTKSIQNVLERGQGTNISRPSLNIFKVQNELEYIKGFQSSVY
jgi:hypothetical protein